MQTLRIIHLRGSQEAMGAQHGRLAVDFGLMEEATDCYPNIAHRMLADANSHQFLGRALHQIIKWNVNRWASKLERQRPIEYLKRSRAFVREIGLPTHLTRQFTLMDVFQNTIGVAGRLRVGPMARAAAHMAVPACSSAMVWGDASATGELLHARNFDFPANGIWDHYPTVVFCEPDDGLRYGYVSTMGVDLPGVTSFNEAGLTVTAHTRFHKDVTFNGRAIVDLTHDIVRRATTLNEALDICREHPVASTWGLAISSTQDKKAVILETTAKRVEEVSPALGRSFIQCTNANRHPDMIAGQVSPFPAWMELNAQGGATAEDLECLLGDHEDPAMPGTERAGGGILAQALSVTSIVSMPEQSAIRVSTSEAPTGWGPYMHIPWDWDQEVGCQTLDWDKPPERTPHDTLRQGMRFQSGDPARGYAHWKEATRQDMKSHHAPTTLSHIKRALEADPDVPTYRFMAGVLELRAGHFETALSHLEAGLNAPQAEFRRGQFLLWGSRAAQLSGHPQRASALRKELLSLTDPHLKEIQDMGRADARKPYSARKARKLIYNIALVDAL
jgi:hypothetical protein